MVRLSLLLILLTPAGALAQADSTLTLATVEHEALAHSPALQAATGSAQAALARVPVGGVDGGLLARGVHHGHPAVGAGLEQPEDEVARHAEDVPHAAPAQRLDHVLAERPRGVSAWRHRAAPLRRAGRC